MAEHERTSDAAKIRWSRTATVVTAVVAVAGIAVGGAVGYGLASAGGSAADGCRTPQQAAVGTTGRSDGPKGGGREALEIVDSGIRPYTVENGGDGTEYASIGFVVKNSTKYVMLDAYVQVFVLSDNDDLTGYEPKLGALDTDTRGRLENVHIPVIRPGQKIGMGTTVLLKTATAVDPGTGETVERDPIDYEELDLDVAVNSAQWWHPEGDVHTFDDIEVSNVRSKRVEQTEAEYADGGQGVELRLDYDAESPYCRPVAAYAPSSVAYDADGNIIGGTMSGWLRSGEQETEYGTDHNRVAVPELDQTYPAGKSDSEEGSTVLPVKIEVPDVKGARFEIYPFTPPLTPNLD